MAIWYEHDHGLDAGNTLYTAQDITDGILAYPTIVGHHFDGDPGDMFLIYGVGTLAIEVEITNVASRVQAPETNRIHLSFGNGLPGVPEVAYSELFDVVTGLTVAGGLNHTSFTLNPANPLVAVNPDYDPDVPFPYYVLIHWTYGAFDYAINLNLTTGFSLFWTGFVRTVESLN